MELPIKTHHIICEQITLEEKNRLNFEEIETNLLLFASSMQYCFNYNMCTDGRK
jgi:hypothetical protein